MPTSIDLQGKERDFKRVCKDRGCSFSEGVRQAVELWMEADDEAIEPDKPSSIVPRGIAKGTWRIQTGEKPVFIPKANEVTDPDGTIRRYKDGKLWAWKSPVNDYWTVKLGV
ncbi:MAG: hypothetical protein ACREBU_15210 [Nitrososphaera sp.]